MMKRTLAGLALALAFFAVAPKAHAQNEDSGSPSTITVAVPTGGFSCGRVSYPEYCYGVPALGGTFWLDVYYTSPSPNGFILFNNVLDLGQATVTGAKIVRILPGLVGAGQVDTLTVTFNGVSNDGDNGTFTGTATFKFTYIYQRGGGGRGGSGFYVQMMQTGTLTITYN
jgi:hypothetical protein